MLAAISLFIVVFLSMLITRVATIALSHTGLSRESARFQARSALTGSGFTTDESEKVVSHPVRRKIILLLMLVGNAGLVTAISTLLLTFIKPDKTESLLLSILVLSVGLTLIWWFAQSQWIDKYLSIIIDRALKRFTSIDVRDYATVLHLSGDYQISEFSVDKEDWIANQSLRELKLAHEGIFVLGIRRDKGNYIGTPRGDSVIQPGDVLTLYGKSSAFEAIDERKKGYQGDKEHQKAVKQQKKNEHKEHQEDEDLQEDKD